MIGTIEIAVKFDEETKRKIHKCLEQAKSAEETIIKAFEEIQKLVDDGLNVELPAGKNDK